MPKVFISYRHDDSSGHAGRLYDALITKFGKSHVFMDLEIEPGLDFEQALKNAVGSCDVLLVVIGRQWLSASEADGRRRLDAPHDWTRLEVAAALERGIRVIPVLVQSARMARAEELPEALRRLAARQALEITDARWEYDVGRLGDIVAKSLTSVAEPPVDPTDKAESVGNVDRRADKRGRRLLGRTGWMVVGIVGVVALAVAIWLWLRRPAGQETSTPVIAVLPLTNLSGDAANDYLGIGIAEVLTTNIASISNITVVSSAAIREALQRSRDTSRVSRDLAASYLVEGSVQQAAGRLRVTLRVLRPDASVLWGDTFEGAHPEMFELQNRIATALITALDVRIPANGRPADGAVSRNPEALDAYWRGRALLERRDVKGNLEAAVASFDHALARDPRFALAQAALGEADWELYSLTRSREWADKAIEAATRALRLDSSSPEVRYSVALTYARVGKRADALDELRRALAIRPQYEDARRLLGEMLAAEGKIDEAITEFKKILERRPNYAAPYASMGLGLLRAGRLSEAIAALEEGVRIQPDNADMYQRLGTAYQQNGQLDRAVETHRRAVAIQPVAQAYSNLGAALHQRGEYGEAIEAYQRAIELRPRSAATHRNLGDAYTRLGSRGEAQRAYAKAVELASEDLAVNPNDPLTRARLAVYEAKVGDVDAAIRDATKAVAAAPGNPGVQYWQAVTYSLSGKPDEALVALERAIALGYSRTQAFEDDDLAALRSRREFTALVAGTTNRATDGRK